MKPKKLGENPKTVPPVQSRISHEAIRNFNQSDSPLYTHETNMTI
jgi:hypothetical protein